MSYSCSPIAPWRRIVASLCAALGLALCAAGLISTGAANAATLPTLSATVGPTSITVSGAQSGAVNVAATATGGKEPSLTLLLLKPGVSVAEVFAFLATNGPSKDPNSASKYGSIVFDNEAGKGKPSEAQTVLAPGQYVALNAEGEKSSTWPRTSFTVGPTPSPAALPPAQATEKTIDFDFRGPSVLKVGELVRFENEGYVVHMSFAFPVKSKKAAQKVVAALLSGHEKGLEKLLAGPPIDFAGPLSTGGFQQEVITAKPGLYVQVCFMTTQDGRPHTRIGMERVIKIVK